MSRIDALLAQMCPKGVEFRLIGDFGQLVRGNGMPKSDFSETGVGCIHYGQIYTFYGAWATETKSFIAQEKAARLAKVDPGDLIITNTSENLQDVCKAVAWLGDTQIVTGGHATVLKHDQDAKYLSYYLQTQRFFADKKRHATGTKVIDVSAKSLAKISIPLPPIEIQREISAVLDKFAELEGNLENELLAEVEARRLQSSFYRDDLLNLNGKIDIHTDVRWMTIGDLGTWIGGMTPSKSISRFWESGTIPWVTSMDISATKGAIVRGRVTKAALDETSVRLVPGPSVAVVMRSNILRRILPVGLIENDATANQDLRLLIPRNDVDARFVYQLISAASENIRKSCVRTDGSMAAVDTKAFFSWKVPVPLLEEQRRITSILEKIDAWTNALSDELPAEMNARREQYEHYRDQLMTFKQAA